MEEELAKVCWPQAAWCCGELLVVYHYPYTGDISADGTGI